MNIVNFVTVTDKQLGDVVSLCILFNIYYFNSFCLTMPLSCLFSRITPYWAGFPGREP